MEQICKFCRSKIDSKSCISLIVMSCLNPLILFHVYLNIKGIDITTSEANYKFVPSLKSISKNYFLPFILFFVSSLIFDFIIHRTLKRDSNLILNYLFSSVFMWVLGLLFI